MKYFPSKEDPCHPVNYIHHASDSFQYLCDVNNIIHNRIFRDLISNNTSNFTLNEEEWRQFLTLHQTSTVASISTTSLVG